MKKIKNIIFIFIFIVFSICIITLNKYSDPYETNKTIYDNSMHYIERDFVYTFLNLTKKFKYNTVIVGGSSCNDALKLGAQQNIALINLTGISPNEQYDLLKYYLKLHPETKNIIVSFEFNTYIKCFNEYTIPRRPTNKLEDFIKLYFSIDATEKSLQKFLQKYLKENEYYQQQEVDNKDIVNTLNSSIKYNYNETCEYDNIEEFKKIYELISEHDLNAIYFIPPTHGLYLAHINEQGYFENTLKLKKELANIVSFYDFSFINKYTTLPPEYLYTDVLHINGHIISKKILNILNNKEKDDNFAIYITKDNVDEVIKKQRKLLQNYIKNNKEAINSYINDDTDLLSENEVNKKVYLKDLPEELQEFYNQNHK